MALSKIFMEWMSIFPIRLKNYTGIWLIFLNEEYED
jgi:hypothetical protein